MAMTARKAKTTKMNVGGKRQVPTAFIVMYNMRKTMLWAVCVRMAMPMVIFLVAQ